MRVSLRRLIGRLLAALGRQVIADGSENDYYAWADIRLDELAAEAALERQMRDRGYTFVKPGHTALLAVVDEPSTEIVDTAMSDLGGTVVRRSVADVEAEVAAAEDAERKAKLEARKELDRARRERDKTAVNAKLDALKAKLHHGQQSEPADADRATVAPAGSAR